MKQVIYDLPYLKFKKLDLEYPNKPSVRIKHCFIKNKSLDFFLGK